MENLFARLKRYELQMRDAYAKGHVEYFRANDDFLGVSRKAVAEVIVPRKQVRFGMYGASVILCGAALAGATALNNAETNRWTRHSTPPAVDTSTPKGGLLDELAQRRSAGKQTDSNTRARSFDLDALPIVPGPEQPLPPSGTTQYFTYRSRESPFEIKAAQGSHYLLKLVSVVDRRPIMTVFVRSGTTVEVDVPLGTYEVKYASGQIWYGYEYLFGPSTSYTKADTTFRFEIIGNEVRGFTITLYKVVDGNLHTHPIDAEDF